MVARSVSFMPSTSIVSPALVAPPALIASMTKWRGPFRSTVSASKRCFIAASVIFSQIAGGQSLRPSVL